MDIRYGCAKFNKVTSFLKNKDLPLKVKDLQFRIYHVYINLYEKVLISRKVSIDNDIGGVQLKNCLAHRQRFQTLNH